MPKNGIVQWGWPEMEELLQCPVCLDIPVSGPGLTVEQCIHGHHVCANCRTQVDSCPLCKCEFRGTRNFVVEELIRHFEVLKNTMLLSGIVTEAKPKKKTKLKLDATAPTFTPNSAPVRRSVNTPNANKGLYPCRVPNCEAKLPAARLLNHVRSFHADVLTESVVDFTDSYNQTWEVPFRNKKPINRYTYVIFVSGIGLIFFNIEILRSGHLVAVIQMAMKFKQAQNFLACIEFFSETIRFPYNSRLVSVRDNTHCMMQKRLCYTLNKNQLKSICNNKKFNCKLRLSRFNPVDSNLLTEVNIEQMNFIGGMRASLIAEENDKKLLKQLEAHDSKKPSASGVATAGTHSSKNVNEINQIIQQIETFGNNLRVLTENIQSGSGAATASSNNVNRASANGSMPSSSIPQTQPVAGRRRKNKNRKNR